MRHDSSAASPPRAPAAHPTTVGPHHVYEICGAEYVSLSVIPPADLAYLRREGPAAARGWGLVRRAATATASPHLRHSQKQRRRLAAASPPPIRPSSPASPAAAKGYLGDSVQELEAQLWAVERTEPEGSERVATAAARLGWKLIASEASAPHDVLRGVRCVDRAVALLDARRREGRAAAGAARNAHVGRSHRGFGLLRLGDAAGAAAALEEACGGLRADTHEGAVARVRLGLALSRVQGRSVEAERSAREGLATLQRLWGDMHVDAAAARSMLGEVLLNVEASASVAGAELTRALDGLVASTSHSSFATSMCKMRLAKAFLRAGVPEAPGSARVLLHDALLHLSTTVGPAHCAAVECAELLEEVGGPLVGAEVEAEEASPSPQVGRGGGEVEGRRQKTSLLPPPPPPPPPAQRFGVSN